jgi:hypothetical protein
MIKNKKELQVKEPYKQLTIMQMNKILVNNLPNDYLKIK